MKAIAIALGVASLAAATFAQAQSTTGSRTGFTMPYERGFWGHVGVNVGRSKLDAPCPAGASCDDSDQAFRAYAGGRFNNTIGGEVGWVNLGEWGRGGGDTDSQALDLVAIAGFPMGRNSSIFGKLGAVYARSEVKGTAVGLNTGKEDGWGPRWGLGAQIGLTDNWALRADWDRYRIKLPGNREDVDTFTIGAQYSFKQ
jgi:opacity protein-like surface antigen